MDYMINSPQVIKQDNGVYEDLFPGQVLDIKT